MRFPILALAIIGAIAIVFVLLGVLIRLIGFLLWIGIIALLVVVIVSLVRALGQRRV